MTAAPALQRSARPLTITALLIGGCIGGRPACGLPALFDLSVVAVSNEAMTVCQYQAPAYGGEGAWELRCARYDVGGTQVARASTALDGILDGPYVTNDSVFALSSRDDGFVLHTMTLASTSSSDQVPVVVPYGVFPDWIMPLRGAPVTGVMLMDRVSDAIRAELENVRTLRLKQGAGRHATKPSLCQRASMPRGR